MRPRVGVHVRRRAPGAARRDATSSAGASRLFRLACIGLAVGMSAGLIGCRSGAARVVQAFPTASMMRPWRLVEPVWSGDFEAATDALGDDANTVQPYAPQRVWLAVYAHVERPRAQMIVRGYSFDSAETASAARAAICPVLGESLRAGDGGCWTELGAAFSAGRLVFDVFVRDEGGSGSSMQAALFVAFIERHLPEALRSAPQ